jgi:uncharacterized membrane protein
LGGEGFGRGASRFFSDAVFAIAITLLALGIRLPEIDDVTNGKLAGALLGVLPEFFGFVISFWIISMTDSSTIVFSATSGPTIGG